MGRCSKSMKVVILCGGLGLACGRRPNFGPSRWSRWGPADSLAHHEAVRPAGLRDFVLCLGYRGSMIKEYFLNYEAMNNDFTIWLGDTSPTFHYHGHQTSRTSASLWPIRASNTMTGGRVKRIEKYLEGDTFLLTYGDGLSDVDIPKLLAFHRAHGKLATVTTVRPISRFGILEIDAARRCSKFAEKPKPMRGSMPAFSSSTAKSSIIWRGDECILEREPLERLARKAS